MPKSKRSFEGHMMPDGQRKRGCQNSPSGQGPPKRSRPLTGIEDWIRFSEALPRWLSEEMRAALAWAAPLSLDRETAMLTVEAALEPDAGAGMPIAPFEDHADEAALWASFATPDELVAYVAAMFQALPETMRREFIDFAQRTAA